MPLRLMVLALALCLMTLALALHRRVEVLGGKAGGQGMCKGQGRLHICAQTPHVSYLSPDRWRQWRPELWLLRLCPSRGDYLPPSCVSAA